MEIFTYVIDGQLEHRDSLGNGAALKPGNLQYMSAGNGIRQDAEINYGEVNEKGSGKAIPVPASTGTPHAWVQVISGEVSLLGETLETADGLAVEDAPDGFNITASKESQFLVFRLS